MVLYIQRLSSVYTLRMTMGVVCEAWLSLV
jgi:hypothetical protein